MSRKEGNILSVDWGKKYVGLAYVGNDMNIVMPIGYIMNDEGMMANIGEIIERYYIKKIVVGYPTRAKEITKEIDNFIEKLSYIMDGDIKFEKQEEAYTSVEAGAMKESYEKDEKEDTLAAIKILERFLEN